jgi:hypothetical protein
VIAEVSKDPATVQMFGRSYTLTFSVQNMGDLDFARHSIGIDCRFDYDSPVDRLEGEIIYRREHFSSSYQSDPVRIRKRQQVTLGDMRINIPVVLASEIGEPAWLPPYPGRFRGGRCNISAACEGCEYTGNPVFEWNQ